MKKIAGLLLAGTMMLSAFLGGCGTSTSVGAATPTGTDASPVKTGLAVIASFGKSKDATAEGDGQTQADITYVAVTVDDSGVIDQCVIDTVQGKVAFDATGKITTSLDTEYDSKQVLGDSYGMKAASGIGKEWHEQIDALESYAQGKTAEQVSGIETDETGHPTAADMVSSATISISSYQEAVAKAVANAKHLGAHKGDSLKLNSTTNIAKSKYASADGDGLGQAYATMMALTLDSQNVVTSCVIDAIQANVNFNTQGQITSDLEAGAKTKMELGDDYGMKAASGIGKEWYEQADAFAAHVTGKALDEAAGMKIEDGQAVDVISSVTISADDFVKLLAMAK